jgi:tetratricopeptide (TPR) repeat protein
MPDWRIDLWLALSHARVRSVLLTPAVHRTIVIVDVEGFGDQRRTNPHQVSVRDGLYSVLENAFHDAGIPWSDCYHEDRGDGVLILAPTEVPKSLFVESLPLSLVKELRRHNAAHPKEAQIRLRMALHAGEITQDAHGVTGAALNFAFRLSDAPALKKALAESPGLLALITSNWFFEDVVQHSPVSEPGSYHQVTVEVKETSTIGWICLPDHPYPAADSATLVNGRASAAPQQLPAYTPHFVGRARELEQLTAYLDAGHQTAVVIAINGTAGVGKTALAVHWAQQMQRRLPDGQLYVNLRGFDATGSPVQPADAIRGFLDAFNVPAERIPTTFDAQAALYRSVLADRRVLVMLDNARDAEQVRPLLPGSPTCVVVITSRDQLVELITWEGAHPTNLSAFDLAEAGALLARRIGRHRLDAEPDAVVHLLDRCVRLPLAIAIVAARLQLNPNLTVRMLADELADESTRLEALDELRAVFASSYQHLDPATARMFRLLGLHPGPEMSATAAASVAGVPVNEARATLAKLTQAHLFTEIAPGRFAFHDLLRAYAIAQTSTMDSDTDRREAIHRLLDHYLHTSFGVIAFSFDPHHDVTAGGPPPPDVIVSPLTNYQQAKSWFATEHSTLLILIDHAYQRGFDVHSWKLAWTFSLYLEWESRWQDMIAIQDSILAAVDRLDDDFARGRVHVLLGWLHGRLGHADEARTYAVQSLEVTTAIGDGFGEACSHFVLALASGLQRLEQDAFDHAKLALDYFCIANDRYWQARTHRLHAWICGQFNNYVDGVEHCQRTLRLLRQAGGSHHEVATIEDFLAWTQHHLCDYQSAILHYRNAIAMYQELTDYYQEARVLRRLGDTYLAAGDAVSARTSWGQAMAILDQLNLPGSDRVRAKLNERLGKLPSSEST